MPQRSRTRTTSCRAPLQGRAAAPAVRGLPVKSAISFAVWPCAAFLQQNRKRNSILYLYKRHCSSFGQPPGTGRRRHELAQHAFFPNGCESVRHPPVSAVWKQAGPDPAGQDSTAALREKSARSPALFAPRFLLLQQHWRRAQNKAQASCNAHPYDLEFVSPLKRTRELPLLLLLSVPARKTIQATRQTSSCLLCGTTNKESCLVLSASSP